MSTDLVAYAVFPDRVKFEAALDALRAAGFRNSDISGDSAGAGPNDQGSRPRN
jgi:hypothetical protein